MPQDYPISGDFSAILQAVAEMPEARHRTLEELRTGADLSDFGPPDEVASVVDMTIPVADGTIPARLYRPCPNAAGVLVYYHGGGWVMGGIATHDIALRALANRTGLAILSADYRLAPEHPFPTPFNDARAALDWAAQRRDGLAGNGAAALLVGGDSAGGNLAATVALASRERGPRLDGQLLIYPSLDPACSAPSYATRADCPLLTAEDMRWYWQQYAAGAALEGDVRFSPAAAADLAGSPPALVAVAGVDPLRDEGLDYARALAGADVGVCLLYFPELPHGFFNFHPLAPSADRALHRIADQLRAMAAVATGA